MFLFTVLNVAQGKNDTDGTPTLDLDYECLKTLVKKGNRLKEEENDRIFFWVLYSFKLFI